MRYLAVVCTLLLIGCGGQITTKSTERSSTTLAGLPCTASLTNANVVFQGDSLTQGWNGTAVYDWIGGLTVPAGWTVLERGMGGQTAFTMATETGASVVDPLYSTQAQMNIAVLWAGTNDLNSRLSNYNQILGYIQTWSLDRRKRGWKVLVATLQSIPGMDDQRDSLNVLLRAHWPEFADGLIDVAAIPEVGADGANLGAYFYSDHLHLTNAGYSLVAPAFRKALNGNCGGN